MRVMLKPFGLSSKVVFDDPAGLPSAPLQRFGCCSPHGAFPVMARIRVRVRVRLRSGAFPVMTLTLTLP